MDREEITIRDLGTRIAAVFGYPSGGADALRFYLLHKGRLPARTVLAMRPHELLAAYDSLDISTPGSELLH